MEVFHSVALKYATEFGQVLTHFDLWPVDDKTQTSMLRYIKQNQRLLTEAFNSKNYKGIDFFSKDKESFWSPFYLSLLTDDILSARFLGMGRGDEIIYGTVLMRRLLYSIKERNVQLSISKQFIDDIKSIIHFGYGVVTVMEEKKYPHDYFRNSPSSPALTTDEEREVKIWIREGHRFETIIRDIYWGNVLTKKHWGSDIAKEKYLLKSLEHECQNNIFWIDDETLFFCAPFDICPQDDTKMLDFKERLYKVFDKLEIEVIRAHLDRYPEPQIDLLQEDINKKSRKLRSKKKLIIRYRMIQNSEPTEEHECVSEILSQAGRLPLIIRPEEKQDGRWVEITVDGRKVPKVRKAVIYCVEKMNMNIEVNPPIDDEDSVADINSGII
jgi:hypothetical protein